MASDAWNRGGTWGLWDAESLIGELWGPKRTLWIQGGAGNRLWIGRGQEREMIQEHVSQPLIPHNRRYCKVTGKDVQGERLKFIERVDRKFRQMHCKVQGDRPCNLVKPPRNDQRDKTRVDSTPDLTPRTWEVSNDSRTNVQTISWFLGYPARLKFYQALYQFQNDTSVDGQSGNQWRSIDGMQWYSREERNVYMTSPNGACSCPGGTSVLCRRAQDKPSCPHRHFRHIGSTRKQDRVKWACRDWPVIRECLALCIVRKVYCSPGQSVESRWAPEATKFPRVLYWAAPELLVSKAETVSPKLSKSNDLSY